MKLSNLKVKKYFLNLILLIPLYVWNMQGMIQPTPLEEEEAAVNLWFDQMQHFSEHPLSHVNLAGTGPVATISPMGLAAHPLLGRYDSNGYDFAIVDLIVRLPKRQLSVFPEEIRSRFQSYSEQELDLYFILFSDNYLGTEKANRNFIYHTCAFPQAGPLSNHGCTISMGMFYPVNLVDFHGDGAMSINHFAPQQISIHPVHSDTALSPNNACFNIDPEQPFCTFFSAAELPNHRAVAFYGILVHAEESFEGIIFETARSQHNLAAFREFILNSSLGADLKGNIERLLTFQHTIVY